MSFNIASFFPKPAVNGKKKTAEIAVTTAQEEHEAQRYGIEECVRLYNLGMLALKIAGGAMVISLGSVAAVLLLIGKLRGPGTAVAYFPAKDGGLVVGGVLTEQLLPNESILAAGVRLWITDARCLRGVGSCDFERKQAKAMTDAISKSDPKGHLDAYFAAVDKERSDDPILERTILSASVTPMPVLANASYLTFRVDWKEQLASSKGSSGAIAHTGQVTISNQHPLATDPDIAQLNPNGLYVEQFATDSDLR